MMIKIKIVAKRYVNLALLAMTEGVDHIGFILVIISVIMDLRLDLKVPRVLDKNARMISIVQT